jgi:hypothetical protein
LPENRGVGWKVIGSFSRQSRARNQLDNLSNVYEEICRECFLPKFIGQLGSYPDAPEIVKKKD